MELKEKLIYIQLFHCGKFFDFSVNSKKTFKFLLIKIAGEIELEDFENIREKFILSYNSSNLNIYKDSDLIESIFKKEIKRCRLDEMYLRIKLDEKKNLKPEMIPLKKDELQVFKIELKEKLDILETENLLMTHDSIEKRFIEKLLKKLDIIKEKLEKRKLIAIESKNYSYMLQEKIRNILDDNKIESKLMTNGDIIDEYKKDIFKFTYFDSERYKNFIGKIEEKMDDLIAFSDGKK